MTERHWLYLAKAALMASIETMRTQAALVADQEIKQRLHAAADYAESIKDQAP